MGDCMKRYRVLKTSDNYGTRYYPQITMAWFLPWIWVGFAGNGYDFINFKTQQEAEAFIEHERGADHLEEVVKEYL